MQIAKFCVCYFLLKLNAPISSSNFNHVYKPQTHNCTNHEIPIEFSLTHITVVSLHRTDREWISAEFESKPQNRIRFGARWKCNKNTILTIAGSDYRVLCVAIQLDWKPISHQIVKIMHDWIFS